MAGGWAKDGAVQDQIDSTVEDGINEARRHLERQGPSLAICEACEAPIPLARQQAVPGVRLCIECQAEADRHQRQHSNYNRRASKDSQLR
ncbi:DksA/TraR family C4-type zinc finger protein [Salinicola avicenniae]|uniref:DksA/TraR family C4-type zinc finger protein n=1 Tax=Salinicola avicenniae TaxID=2916836 RepID=UPI0020744B99|nr:MULTISPECIES: DksA/TraR family C4-type zinc finger protein [unclassified Salinicola]